MGGSDVCSPQEMGVKGLLACCPILAAQRGGVVCMCVGGWRGCQCLPDLNLGHILPIDSLLCGPWRV